MNKITITNLCMAIYCFFSLQINAQENYTYTLIDNGSYSFTIAAVPDPSASNFPTSVQSYGFTIIVPDGVTATVTSSLGNGAGATFFDGTNVGNPSIDGYLITETLGTPIALPAPSAGTTSPMVTIQINGAPTSGILEILANDSSLATTVTPLKSFLTADTTDDGSANFSNTVDSNGSGLSGTSSFDFATLTVKEIALANVSIYPNPASSFVFIKNQQQNIERITIYSMNGQLIKSETQPLEKMDIRDIHSGIYILKIDTEKGSKSVKFVRQ